MDRDEDWANAAQIPGGADYPARWAAEARAFREYHADCWQELTPGPLDLVRPEGPPRGLCVFLHGGYWSETGHRDWSHLAQGALARGWACAIPAQPRAPDRRTAAITRAMGAAIALAATEVAGPIVVAGHSSGGHLAARMATATAPLSDAVARRVVRVLPLSPLAELAPFLTLGLNRTLRLTPREAARESPARLPLRAGVAVRIVVGAQERAAFLWQGRRLSEAWTCPWDVVPGRHHFDILDELSDPASPSCDWLFAGGTGS